MNEKPPIELARELAKWILPILEKNYNVITKSLPYLKNEYMEEEKWISIIDDIIYSFVLLKENIEIEDYPIADVSTKDKKVYARYNRGLKLFNKYWRNIWW